METDDKELLGTLACRYVKLRQTIDELTRHLNHCFAVQLDACEKMSKLSDEWNKALEPESQGAAASIEALTELWESDSELRARFGSLREFVSFANRQDRLLDSMNGQ
jgi:hypothetical protein